ncbi:alpha/beta-hydrolase [Hypoxylon sp. FL1284]|nr:alpha/beta-hydrolase [Hypoxylon sp. FL1284]
MGIKAEDVFPPHILAKYDPEMVKYVLATKESGIPAQHEVPIAEIRANPAKYAAAWSKDVSDYERVVESGVASKDGAKVPIMIYHPDPAKFGPGPYGLHLNFHGGGFVLGSLTTDADLCLGMRDAGVVVIDVNYRHCPETIWGKCVEDAWAVLLWARESANSLKISPDSISLGGISAGAHICLIMQHMARDAGVPLKLCLATVPAASEGFIYNDYTESPFKSFHDFAFGPVLPWARMKFFGDLCFPRDKAEEIQAMWPDWWVAPLKAKNWTGLCDTFIRTGECDPLRDEGEAYGSKLIEGGNKVTMKRYIGAPHIFMYLDWFRKHEFDADTVTALQNAHGIA